VLAAADDKLQAFLEFEKTLNPMTKRSRLCLNQFYARHSTRMRGLVKRSVGVTDLAQQQDDTVGICIGRKSLYLLVREQN
jgi:hypothetical protein